MHRALAIAVLVCGAFGSGAFGEVALAEPLHRYRNPASICVDLKVEDHLSGPALNTLKEEAAHIWIRHGMVLKWTTEARDACDVVVPIFFDEREMVKQGGRSRSDALGLTVFFGRAQTIYVSVPRAFRLLGQMGQFNTVAAAQGEWDYRGGMLLGRVVAHELGHVLLTTLKHADSGLMRPVFTARDALSPDEKATDLSPADTNRLVMRFSLIPIDAAAEALAALTPSAAMASSLLRPLLP
jgi:hypothetical protein